MNTIRKIFEDYEKLIKTKIKIPVDNGDMQLLSKQSQTIHHPIRISILNT